MILADLTVTFHDMDMLYMIKEQCLHVYLHEAQLHYMVPLQIIARTNMYNLHYKLCYGLHCQTQSNLQRVACLC